jgi:hypothetical protein
MGKVLFVVLSTFFYVILKHAVSVADEPREYYISIIIFSFVAEMIMVNLFPLVIAYLARITSRKSEAFFPAWLFSFCLFGLAQIIHST